MPSRTLLRTRPTTVPNPDDAYEEDRLSLRGNAEEITEKLAVELTARVQAAGVTIVESRFTHLAYAPEIASAMLRASRPARWWPRGRPSWKAPAAWSRTPSPASPSRTSSRWTRSARRPWWATCSSCCAATARRSRCSTPGPCTSAPAAGRRAASGPAAAAAQTGAAAARSRGARRAGALGGGRTALDERADRLPAAPRPARRGPPPEGRPPPPPTRPPTTRGLTAHPDCSGASVAPWSGG